MPWIAHEIEQPGSWHTAVGHENSFAADRYKFDLNLLEKDLLVYPHDPHTHYYLGITNEALASKMYQNTGSFDEISRVHIDNAVKYLSIRATATYADEFIEERWATMMLLGSIYMNMLVSKIIKQPIYNCFCIHFDTIVRFIYLL